LLEAIEDMPGIKAVFCFRGTGSIAGIRRPFMRVAFQARDKLLAAKLSVVVAIRGTQQAVEQPLFTLADFVPGDLAVLIFVELIEQRGTLIRLGGPVILGGPAIVGDRCRGD